MFFGVVPINGRVMELDTAWYRCCSVEVVSQRGASGSCWVGVMRPAPSGGVKLDYLGRSRFEI